MTQLEARIATLRHDAEQALQAGRPEDARVRILEALELGGALPEEFGAYLDYALGAMLRRAAPPLEAGGYLARAGLRLESLGDGMKAGSAFYEASFALEEGGELSAAVDAAERAARVFRAGVSNTATDGRGGTGLKLVGGAMKNAGRLNQRLKRWAAAAAFYVDAIPWLVAGQGGEEAGPDVADCEARLGECLYRCGAYVAAAPHLSRGAEMFLFVAQESVGAYVLNLLASAKDLAGDRDGAADTARRALRIAERVGAAEVAERARHLLLWNGAGDDEAEAGLAAERARATGVQRADIDWDLSIFRHRKGDLVAARSALSDARQRYADLGNEQRVAQCDLELARLLVELGDAEGAVPLAEEAVIRFGQARWLRGYVEASTVLAELLADREPTRAIMQAFIAVAAADDLRFQLGLPEDRELWASGSHNEARAVALRLVHRAGDPAAAAELIESARVQAVPGDAVAGCVAVGGFSRLIIARRAFAAEGVAVDPPEPVLLHEAAEAVGGPGAWWLGSWLARDQTLWTSAVSREQVAAGRLDATAGSPLLGSLSILFQSLPFEVEGETRGHFDTRMLGSALQDPGVERKLADALGRFLIPELLRDHLRSTTRRVPVVIAPCFLLSWVPWGILTIDDDGTRLLERADVLVAPAASVIARIDGEAAAGRRLLGGPGPLHAAVADPDGTLPAAASLGRRLNARGVPVLARGDATPAGVRTALAGVTPGAGGAVVFACHARVGEHNRQVLCLAKGADGLCPVAGRCCGGSPIDAAGLFAEGGIRFPGRVLAAACDSSGSRLIGHAGEWFGLAPAALWAGARLVLATIWPILDNEPSAAFENDLVELLASAVDPVGALHQLQVGALARWRDGDLFASPLFWASYAALGFRAC